MGIARLIEKADGYYCSHCFMKQKTLVSECAFCNSLFTNFEDMLRQHFKNRELDL